MLTLPNGKQVDEYMLEAAMEDADLANMYFLNTQTGEVVFFSEYDDDEEREKLSEEIDGSNDYIRIDRIPSSEAYQWMADFVDEVVAPKDQFLAEKLSIALRGRGAFRRFKEVLHESTDKWVQAWYQWKDNHLKEACINGLRVYRKSNKQLFHRRCLCKIAACGVRSFIIVTDAVSHFS
jgi:Uncharacterised protein family (UPF0158)